MCSSDLLSGTLSKWTNYIHGWQDRYIVLKDGTLSYYKSETETSFGCRGAVSLVKAVITPHEFDECRFDVTVNDCLWYLRARNAEERQHWIDSLEVHKAESGYGSENSLRRHGSMLSLTSTASLSTASASSFKRGRGLREKLAEMETFRDILTRQVDTLQSYFDGCSAALNQSDDLRENCTSPTTNGLNGHDILSDDIDEIDDLDHANGEKEEVHLTSIYEPKYKDILNVLQDHGAHAIDFKGESFTFKATTAGILATLSHCIELMTQREDAWKKRLEKEIDKRKKIEEAYKLLLGDKPKRIVMGGPDYEEGPHMLINEDEFYDAVDASLDKLEREEERRQLSKAEAQAQRPPLTSLSPTHPMYNEINKVVHDHIVNADMTASDVADTWTLIAEEGEMRVYKKEHMEDGLIVDPVKAVHSVKGITGHEMCHYFWDQGIRLEWDFSLETSTIVDWVSQDTLITYQTHKRVWPASQRDSLFWSTIRHCPSELEDGPDYWIVANHSMEHPSYPLLPGNMSGKCVRISFNVCMICQTVVDPPENGPIVRDNLTCRIQYSARVNPGGWAPASVVRMISKREMPKFLRTFTAYVREKVDNKPIMF